MEEFIEKAVSVLKKGGTILYPTDTIWGIGCDPTNNKAVDKVYKIKKRPGVKSMIILADSFEMIENYVEEIPNIVNDLVKSVTEPLTVVYPNAKNLAKNVVAEDKSIAIRIVEDNFCKELIKAFGKPIVSTSANVSGEESPITFALVKDTIRKNVDYIVPQEATSIKQVRPSTIIRLSSDTEFEILRS